MMRFLRIERAYGGYAAHWDKPAGESLQGWYRTLDEVTKLVGVDPQALGRTFRGDDKPMESEPKEEKPSSGHYPVKQVIVVRRDVRNVKGEKIKSGKLAVQVAHASMAWIGERLRDEPPGSFPLTGAERQWLVDGSFAKIVLGVDSLEELQALCEKARAANMTVQVITDVGHTEFGGVPTVTCAGLGPHFSNEFDAITGHLRTL